MQQRTQKSSQNSPTQDKPLIAPHSLIAQRQQDAYKPSMQEDAENQAFDQNRASQFSYNFADVPPHSPSLPPSIASPSIRGIGSIQPAVPPVLQQHPVPLLQAKLTIGQPNDRYEQEADRMASQVVNQIQSPPASHPGKTLQPQATHKEENKLQLQPLWQNPSQSIPVTPKLEAGIERSRPGGQPLSAHIRNPMEQAFGTDFSHVRVHTDAAADQLNRSIQAKAFTTGQDVFFRQGAYEPGNRGGQELIAHELTHVVQQNGATVQQGRIAATTSSLNSPVPIQSIRANSGVIARHPAKVIQRQFALDETENIEAAKQAKVKATDVQAESQVLDGLEVGISTSGISTVVSDEYGVAKSRGHAELDSGQDARLGVSGGVTDTLSMFTGIASAIKAYREQEATADKTGAVLSGIQSGLTGAKGVSAIVNKAGAGGKSLEAAGTLSGITDGFSTIKETFFVIKEIVGLVKNAQTLSSEEKFYASMRVIQKALEAAKGGVSAAKSFYDTWGGGAAGSLVQSVPGLGLALGCVDLIVRGFTLITAEIHKAKVRAKKRELKTRLGGETGKSSQDLAEQILAGTLQGDKDAAEEYLFAKGLQYINQKRSNRAILKISVAMAKISGDAATLGGASAPVGIGLKAGAMGVDVGASIFRTVKQKGRDKAATSATDSFWRSVFSADRSTTAKLAEYEKTINTLFDMIIKASEQSDAAKREITMERCSDYVAAIGFSIEEMHRYRNDVDELRKKMFEALKRRE